MPQRTAADNLVLGTWGLAGRGGLSVDRSYGEVTDAVAYETLDRAWELGIRIADTAPAYGGGAGLRRVGQWQRMRDRRWRIAAKPGRPDVGGGPVSDLRLPVLVDEVESGARLTGTPAYVLVKDPEPGAYTDGSLAAVLDLLEERLPDATVGVASHLPEALAGLAARCPARTAFPADAGPVAPRRARVAQIELNAVNHRVAVPAAERLAARGWEVWAMQPLAYGFLACPDLVPRPGADWRARIPSGVQDGMRAAARSFAWVTRAETEGDYGFGVAGSVGKRGPEPESASLAAWAIAFCLSVPAVTRTVVGPKNPAQLDAAVTALSIVSDHDRAHRLHTWAAGAMRDTAGATCPR
ncbi:aldo/keto reductase [Streptomyces sp. NPDC006475]|uniref:aldo/keto reductase n=1 Tax=Streptomyces sp. NPDC006475 TaxID=3155719 RepID=UPI0033B5D12E